ncbi:hypothetical protein ACX0G7_09855 [Flavitalea antarctica]
MSEQKTYRLTKTITSHVDPSKVYGLQNEQVTVISDERHPLLIVQGEKCRFSVFADHLTDRNVGNITETESQPEFVAQKAPAKKQPTKSTFKPDSSSETLF